MSKNPLQLELTFPSLDRPDKGALSVGDMAELLNCSRDHISNLLCDGIIGSANIGRRAEREYRRVPREEWQRFLITTFGAFDRKKYLAPMPSNVLRDIINDCYATLRVRGEK